MSKLKAELVLKSLIGDKGLESLKKHVFHQDSQSPLTPLDLYLPLLVVPRAIMSWLVQNVQPMEIGEIKDLDFPNSTEIKINIEKQGIDSYRSQFIRDGKVFHEFEKTNLPAIGGHLMTVGEMYDSFSDETCKNTAEVPKAIMDMSGISEEIHENRDSIAHVSIKEFSNIIGRLIDALVSNNLIRNTISQALHFRHEENETPEEEHEEYETEGEEKEDEHEDELEKEDLSESKQKIKQNYTNKKRLASLFTKKAETGPTVPAGGAKPKAPKQPQAPVPRGKQPLNAQKKQGQLKAQPRLQTQQTQQRGPERLPTQERGMLKEEINSYFRNKIRKSETLEKANSSQASGGFSNYMNNKANAISAKPATTRTPVEQKIHTANVISTKPQTTTRAIEGSSGSVASTGPFKSYNTETNIKAGNKSLQGFSSSTELANKDATPSMKAFYGNKHANYLNESADKVTGAGNENLGGKTTGQDMQDLTSENGNSYATSASKETATLKEELGVTEMEPTANKDYFRNKLKKTKVTKKESHIHMDEHELYTPCIHCGVPEFQKNEDGQPKYKPCACFMVTLMSEEGNDLPFVQVVRKKESGYTLSFNPKADKETVEVFIETLKNRLLERKGRNK